MLDLTHILLADHSVAHFATKREALTLARARGWNTCDVMRAENRFHIFWVVESASQTAYVSRPAPRVRSISPYRPETSRGPSGLAPRAPAQQRRIER